MKFHIPLLAIIVTFANVAHAQEFRIQDFAFQSKSGSIDFKGPLQVPMNSWENDLQCGGGSADGKHKISHYSGNVILKPNAQPIQTGWIGAHGSFTDIEALRNHAPGWAQAATTWLEFQAQAEDNGGGYTIITSAFSFAFWGYPNWYDFARYQEGTIKSFRVSIHVMYTTFAAASYCSAYLPRMFSLRDESPI